MKRIFSIVSLLVLTLFLVTSCQKDTLDNYSLNNENLSNENLENPNNLPKKTFGKIKPKVSIKVKGKLHRGDKWSKKHHVKPCTHSFGVCHLKVEVEVEVEANLKVSQISAPNNGVALFRLTFLKPVEAQPGDVFMSKEDGEFIFPSELSKEFDFNQMTLLPKDYIYQPSTKDQPNGYVDVVCKVQ